DTRGRRRSRWTPPSRCCRCSNVSRAGTSADSEPPGGDRPAEHGDPQQSIEEEVLMSPQPPSSQQAAPNILFVLTDDQGPWALGRESPELVTPTLDRLAEEGTYLERFFCTSPVCSPARASLLTGRMPSAHGVHDWLRPEGVGRPGPQGGYLEGIPTIAGELEQAGYR